MQPQKVVASAHRTDFGCRDMTTDEVAAILHVLPQSVRASVCRNGHYLGIKPRKLPNRLLSWLRDAVEKLLEGEVA